MIKFALINGGIRKVIFLAKNSDIMKGFNVSYPILQRVGCSLSYYSGCSAGYPEQKVKGFEIPGHRLLDMRFANMSNSIKLSFPR